MAQLNHLLQLKLSHLATEPSFTTGRLVPRIFPVPLTFAIRRRSLRFIAITSMSVTLFATDIYFFSSFHIVLPSTTSANHHACMKLSLVRSHCSIFVCRELYHLRAHLVRCFIFPSSTSPWHGPNIPQLACCTCGKLALPYPVTCTGSRVPVGHRFFSISIALFSIYLTYPTFLPRGIRGGLTSTCKQHTPFKILHGFFGGNGSQLHLQGSTKPLNRYPSPKKWQGTSRTLGH